MGSSGRSTPRSGTPPPQPSGSLLADALRAQAERLMRNERWEAAELVVNEALALPDDGTLAADIRAQLLDLRAECVAKQVRGSDTAVADAERATATASTYGPVFLKLGAAMEDANRLADAAAAYDRAAKLCTDPLEAEAAAAKACRLQSSVAASQRAAPQK